MSKLYPSPFPPPWAEAWGDDVFGLWTECQIGDVVQRLRWISPGQFLMGSPEDELDRGSDEGPQHLVSLTDGYWLADTACMQAVWQAVMGDNPSDFKGDDLPVEQVSWDDVQSFLKKLQTQLPVGVDADLPTETEWEYACRAGAATPFSFGENIRTEQVNYDGNHPYGDAPKGECRAKTVPVKALPANDWGLYQMHGNVWEYCADAPRNYTADAVINPRGARGKDNEWIVVRGGGWFLNAHEARSARRDQGRRGDAHFDQGFRFVLRSTGQARAEG